MNHNLLLLQDSESECSFDSSQFCSIGERTVSIDSNAPNNKLQSVILTPTMKTRSIDEGMAERTISIQKPRIQMLSQKNIFQQQDMFQVGFVMGKNKKNVAFNESKIKKAKNFFDQEELAFLNQDSLHTHSLFQFPKRKETELKSEEIIVHHELSNPCFQNFGKNKNAIQIDKNLLQKAKDFFNDDFEDTNTLLPSFKKPTKIKKPLKQPQTETQENFIKTVNVNKNKKKVEVKQILKKQIFDWNRFFISSKKLASNEEKTCRKSSRKKSSNIKTKTRSTPKIIFQTIKFQELNWQQLHQSNKMQSFLERKLCLATLTFHHEKSECKIIKCLLCDIGIQETNIDKAILQQVFTNRFILQKIDTQNFAKLYDQICFKLLKYDTFYPQIINKRLNPSNILVQMHKKTKLIETGNPCLGWVDFCLKQSKFYHSFLVQVKQIHHNQKIKTYFLKLSDGWTNVWAVITEKNYLYSFTHQVKIFSKLFIGHWKVYALGNVLSFCPLSKANQKCIEIWYNSTIIVKENMKLGKPSNMIFYRSLDKNRKQGGLVPTVEGIILRMFCSISQSKKKSSSYPSTDQSFNENYVQILTPQGYCVLIKFILPSQRSLAELFRLYYRYHFYFLKISAKDNILQFNDDISKFFEFDKKEKKQYDRELIEVLNRRYINIMKDNIKLQKKLKIGSLYDIFLQGNQSIVNGLKFVIDNNNNQHDTAANSFLKSGSLLYQQYELDKLSSMKNSNNNIKENSTVFILKRTKFSNTLKTLPALYKELNYMQ